MSYTPGTLLMRYQYDALDRLVSSMPAGEVRQDRYYQNDQFATEIQDEVQHQIFQGAGVLLAEQQKGTAQRTSLLITDKPRSVLQSADREFAYTPYGFCPVEEETAGRLGFNGERRDTITGHYLLGNGHRAFNPTLMRFNRPDSLSPFGEGGLNCYAYCGGDPINRTDPTGRTWYGWAWFANSALGMVDDYLIPLLPKRLARRIPAVANRTFGKVTKSMAEVSGFSASALYLVMNRVEAYFPQSPVNDPLFYAFLTTSTFTVVNSAAHTLHKLAVRGARPLLPRTGTQSLPNRPVQLQRAQSLPDLRNHTSAPRPVETLDIEPDVTRDATTIRQGE